MAAEESSARGRFSQFGGIAALLAAGVLLAGIIGLATGSSWLQPWLVVLFGIDSGTGGVSMASLSAIVAVDVVLLALAGVAFAGFWPGPGTARRFWMVLAILLPVAGIAVLVTTGLAGRSGLMGGLLVLSCIMLSDRASRSLGCAGLGASLLLLIGDFTTTGPPSALVATLVATGYVVLTAWFLLVGARLLGWQRSRHGRATGTDREPSGSRQRKGLRHLAEIEGEIVIERPVGEVFDFIADERNEPRYNPQMTSVEQLSEGEVGLGTRFKAQVISGGRPLSMVIEFTRFDRPVRLRSRTTMPGMAILGELNFDAVGDATRMRWAWDMRPAGALRLLKPLIIVIGRRQERDIWTSMKRYLEA